MTIEEAVKRLRDLNEQRDRDAEYKHFWADEVLCDLLTELGYADVVFEWSKINKWYA